LFDVNFFYSVRFPGNIGCRTPMSSGASRSVTVHFHIVINTSEFHFNAENDFVEMRFSTPSLGDWKSMGHKMKVEK
jgi:hypothetical protein